MRFQPHRVRFNSLHCCWLARIPRKPPTLRQLLALQVVAIAPERGGIDVARVAALSGHPALDKFTITLLHDTCPHVPRWEPSEGREEGPRRARQQNGVNCMTCS